MRLAWIESLGDVRRADSDPAADIEHLLCLLEMAEAVERIRRRVSAHMQGKPIENDKIVCYNKVASDNLSDL
jgi:hypothetical protein